MSKVSPSKPAARGSRSSDESLLGNDSARTRTVQRQAVEIVVSKARFEAVMRAAEQSGLLSEKSGRIGGRVSPALVRQAKRQTGIEADTDLIEFALATVALEDSFADTFKKSRGKIDRGLILGF